jgi:hypothetical protein
MHIQKLRYFSRKTINEIGGSQKSFIPVLERHVGMGKQRITDLSNVTIFSFS